MDVEQVATAYFEALYAQDFDRVTELASPELVFEDPTGRLSSCHHEQSDGTPSWTAFGPHSRF